MHSCGGVVGKIHIYEFELSQDSLEHTVEKTYQQFPEIRLAKGSIYGNEGTGHNYDFREVVLKDDGEIFILSFAYPGDKTSLGKQRYSALSLVSGAKFGEILEPPTDINRFRKRKYQALFEEYFINRIETINNLKCL